MLTLNNAFYELKNKLSALYDERESVSIAHELLLFITGLNKVERIIQKLTILTTIQQNLLDKATAELLNGRPLQYVIGTTYFNNLNFFVNESVLIPRPETEELVQKVINDFNKASKKLNVLDIGTGSGCIAISIKKALENISVTACDISNEAINIAKQNASALSVNIEFIALDFLNSNKRNTLQLFDIIVSNPPYIPIDNKQLLHVNVKNYEPDLALFVPQNNQLVFYNAIAEFGKTHLMPNGSIYCELETDNAVECKKLFENYEYQSVELLKDINGNWRILIAKI